METKDVQDGNIVLRKVIQQIPSARQGGDQTEAPPPWMNCSILVLI